MGQANPLPGSVTLHYKGQGGVKSNMAVHE